MNCFAGKSIVPSKKTHLLGHGFGDALERFLDALASFGFDLTAIAKTRGIEAVKALERKVKKENCH